MGMGTTKGVRPGGFLPGGKDKSALAFPCIQLALFATVVSEEDACHGHLGPSPLFRQLRRCTNHLKVFLNDLQNETKKKKLLSLMINATVFYLLINHGTMGRSMEQMTLILSLPLQSEHDVV